MDLFHTVTRFYVAFILSCMASNTSALKCKVKKGHALFCRVIRWSSNGTQEVQIESKEQGSESNLHTWVRTAMVRAAICIEQETWIGVFCGLKQLSTVSNWRRGLKSFRPTYTFPENVPSVDSGIFTMKLTLGLNVSLVKSWPPCNITATS